MKIKYLTSILLVLIVSPLQATDFKRISTSPPQDNLIDSATPKCASLIKECITKDQNMPTDCLFAVSNHPFCEGSILGKLSYRRWQLSGDFHTSVSMGNYENLISNKCLAKFDNYFLKLINSADLINQTNLIKISESLELCNQQDSINFARP